MAYVGVSYCNMSHFSNNCPLEDSYITVPLECEALNDMDMICACV